MKKVILTAGMLTALAPILSSEIAFANTVTEVSVKNEYVRGIEETLNTTGKVNLSSSTVLNIRSTPSTNSKVVGKIKGGSTIKIIGKASNGWYKVKYNNVTGYSSNKYILLTANESVSGNKGKVNTTTSNLNIRKGSGTQYPVIGKLSPRTIVTILKEESNGWYYIESNGKKGYVSENYITKVSGSYSSSTSQNIYTNNIGKIATVNTKVLNLRSGGSTKYSIINKLYSGNNVKILDSNKSGWYKVELSSGLVGWCSGEYLTNFRVGNLNSSSSSDLNSSTSENQSAKAQAVINLAKSKLGCSYEWGAEGPNTFDCSGFTYYVYKQSTGVSLPRVSRDQAKVGKYVAKSDLQPGDLIFFDSNYGSNVNHVGIYIGNDQMIHSPKPGDVVKITNISSNYYKKAYVTARRVL